MKYVMLNQTDLILSNMCLGTATFGDKLNKEQAFELLDDFVRSGGNFIDAANVYYRWIPGKENCSEKILGQWMKSRGSSKNVVIATKGGYYSFDNEKRISRINKTEISKDIENSLNTLGLEYLDFYWLHRDDESKSIEEIIDILEQLKNGGKIRYYGLSNYKVERLEQARLYLESKGLCGSFGVFNSWSLATKKENVLDDSTLVEFTDEEYRWHINSRVALMPYLSVAQGFFSKLEKAGINVGDEYIIAKKRYKTFDSDPIIQRYWNYENLLKYELLRRLQRQTGYSLHALSIKFLLNHPFQVFPICGASNVEQLKEVMSAF